MFNFKFIFLVIFLFILHETRPEISDKRLCANENCTKPISQAKTILRYSSPDRRILSFAQNADVTVYSKSAGSNMDLWGVEVHGKRGYAPKKFLRETKVFTKQFPFLLDTELHINDMQVPSNDVGVQKETIKASKASEYDVVDGTTFYLTPDNAISSTTTETAEKAAATIETADENSTIPDVDENINEKTEPLKLDETLDSNSDNLQDIKDFTDNDNSESEDNKESIVNNLFQSVTDWIKTEEKTDEKLDDYEDEDEYDDTEEDETEESEEIEDNDIDRDDTVSSSEEILNQNSVEEVDNQEVSNTKLEHIEKIVKTRQLLSKEEAVDSMATNIDEKEEERIKIAVTESNVRSSEDSLSVEKSIANSNQKENVENTVSDLNMCSDENCLKKDEILENVTNTLGESGEQNLENTINDSIAILGNNASAMENNTDEEGSVMEATSDEEETATEASFIEIPEIELPIPDDSATVTPNSIQNDQNILPINSAVSDTNNKELSEHNIIDDNKMNSNLENKEVIFDHSETGEIDVTDDNQENYSDQSETVLSDLSTDNNIEEQSDEQVKDTNVKIEEKSRTESSSFSKDESLSSKENSTTIEKETPTEIQQESGSDNFPQDDQSLKSENLDDISENTAGILSGIYSNWFVKPIDDKADESVQQEENKDNINKNLIEEEKNDEIDLPENVEIEVHDHSFESMLNDKKHTASTEELKSSHSEQLSVVPEEITEVPKEEIVIEDVVKSDLSYDVNKQDETEEQNVMPEKITEVPKEVIVTDDVVKSDLIDEVNRQGKIAEILEEETSVLEEAIKEEFFDIKEKPQILDIGESLLSKEHTDHASCPADGCLSIDISAIEKQLEMEELQQNLELDYTDFFNLFTLLAITGLSVVVFLLGYISIDKNRKEGPLIARINTLEKALLVANKENDILADKITEMQEEVACENDRISNEELENIKAAYQELLIIKSGLEDQIQSLEKELENSTEVGLELNRMLQDILSSQNGSEILIANVEQLQRQLVEQQGTINSINDTLNLKDTENHELQLELEIKNKKVTHLQTELDKMAMNLFKVEEDKEQMQAKLEGEIIELKDQFEKNKNTFNSTRTKLLDEINALKTKYSDVQRTLELKTNEYTILKDNFNQIQAIKNNTEALESLLNASSMKAELQQFQRDNQALTEVLRQEQQTKFTLEKQVEIALQEAQSYKAKYDESDKTKLEALTKLEVLSNYFKEKETQLQKELSKHESLWMEQQGEATSTSERIKYMQEELKNFKSQNESLKQEIISQEVELKSQISVLEKKAHENWVAARQAERRVEDAKQEAAQLRNRLTLKERTFIEDKGQNRMQSPLEQNGDLGISPLHMPIESPASPPLLYGTRDHLTTSPPIPNMPPFLPPPPGVPFIPPPLPGVPGFMPPPPPSMFSVDHRPPPLGRMSSPPPPLNSRYSPDSRYSPYDRNTPSPPYYDDYGPSPPPVHREYNPFNNRDDRREYKRPPPARTNGRNKGALSSGSGNSNDSLEKINRHHSKV